MRGTSGNDGGYIDASVQYVQLPLAVGADGIDGKRNTAVTSKSGWWGLSLGWEEKHMNPSCSPLRTQRHALSRSTCSVFLHPSSKTSLYQIQI